MTGESWGEFQKRTIERLDEGLARAWGARVEFWKHVVMVEATVLGLSVGLLGVTGAATSWVLVWAWLLLLGSILAGCSLIHAGIEAEQARRIASFRTTYDVAELQARVASGALRSDSEEFQALMTAAVMEATPPWQRAEVFTPKARELAARWGNKLPSAAISQREGRQYSEWAQRYLLRIEKVFYGLSLAAVLLLAVAVVSGGPERSSQASRVVHAPRVEGPRESGVASGQADSAEGRER